MFDFLKKKISGFVDKLTRKEEEKEPEKPPEREEKAPKRKPEPMAKREAPEPKPVPKPAKRPAAAPKGIPKAPQKEKRPEPVEAPRPAPETKAGAAKEKPKKAPEPPKETVKPAPVKRVEEPKAAEEPKPAPARKIERPEAEPKKPAEAEPEPREEEEAPEPIAPAMEPKPGKEQVKEKPKPVLEVFKEKIGKALPKRKPEKAPEPAQEVPEAAEEIEEEPAIGKEGAGPEIEEPAQGIPEAETPEPVISEEAEEPGPVGGIAGPEAGIEEPEILVEEEIPAEKPKERLRLGAVGAIKSFITREVEISEGDVKDLLENLELELLESDVELSVAEGIREELMEKLVGAKVRKDELQLFINDSIKGTLIDTITNEKSFDILERVESSEKPIKIMFLGINGAGKTTTIGKVAKLLMDNDKKVVFAAADTFRAAAIEQMGVHAERLGVKMIKRDYGSDPTSVAFDAMNYAKARGIDAVLIDTAGRQDTNISLLNEIKKMNRVIQPELRIYIGESIAGNAILEQIQAFDREIGIDGVILTKLDCDPKGGTMLSINKATGIPIIYVGMGQRYEDLEPFDAARMVERIVG